MHNFRAGRAFIDLVPSRDPVEKRVINLSAPSARGTGRLILAAGALAVLTGPVLAEEGAARLLIGDAACAAGDAPGPGEGPTLDLYGPERAAGQARPIVLFVHGGGWRHGDKANVRDAFGDDPQAQREASPITHVAAGKRYPPFLIFHVGQRRDSREQAESLAERLRAAGGEATTVHEPDETHLTLNRELGVAGNGPTAKILEFLEAR